MVKKKRHGAGEWGERSEGGEEKSERKKNRKKEKERVLLLLSFFDLMSVHTMVIL